MVSLQYNFNLKPATTATSATSLVSKNDENDGNGDVDVADAKKNVAIG